MPGKQPLTSIEAFALALVEASSRLVEDTGTIVSESTPAVALDDEPAQATE